ncbi:MAG TPA: BamA/TamA family outer membrane protein, partial [Candidatus Krumholzibacteria bacterium]|nr:BamA/TamA family outer membrane protein [Candidatus Krumholzibacteria bacterium]
LGEFRGEFRGLVGTFEEYPRAAGDGHPGCFGATEIINGEELWKRMDENWATRPDSRAFLKARLVDLLVGDWDRHRGQWRWAKLPAQELWQPIPEDRDQAFVRFEGLVVNAGRMQLPQFVSFGDDYPGIDGLVWNGRDGDRRILVDMDRDQWMEVARDVQSRIGDDVVAEAVERLPAPYRELEGAATEAALRSRRDNLLEIADVFYRFIARDVDVRLTAQDELVRVIRGESGDVSVSVSPRNADSPAFYRRTFLADETDEVRIYLGGGADSVVSQGGDGKITVRVIGGDGTDAIDDAAGVGLRVSDADTGTRLTPGHGTRLDSRPYTPPAREKAPWIPPRDWGRRNIWYPFIGGNSDVGVLFLLGWQSEGYGFRKDPYSDKHVVRVGYATEAGGFGGDYRGEYRRENSRSYAGLYLRGSGLDFLHFYGFGNESPSTEDEDFYKVKQSLYKIEPSYTCPLAGPLMATVRANVAYAKTKLEPNQFITDVHPYGAEDFLQYGAGLGLSIDTRDSDVAPMRGAHVAVDGTVFPAAADVASAFGEVHGEAAYYQPIGILSTPTLALRAGGKKVWRDYPYYEAAYIGGSRTVRGFPQQRFAGDASVFGNAELRIPLTRIYIFVPGSLGVFALADIGRVYLEGESSDTWHTSAGGGIWCSFLNTANTASLAVAASEEGTRVYVLAGLAF